jgi:hypothetical protein
MSLTKNAISSIIDTEIKNSVSKIGQIAIGEIYFDPGDSLGYITKEGKGIKYTDLQHQMRVEGTVNVEVVNPDTTISRYTQVSMPQPSTQFSLLSGGVKVGDKVMVYSSGGAQMSVVPLALGFGIERTHTRNRGETIPKNYDLNKGKIYQ